MKISIDLVANTGTFNTDVQRSARNLSREMRRAQREAEQANQNIANSFKTLGQQIVGALAIREVIQFAAATVNSVANLNDLAEKTGDTAEEFATLQLAADLSGVSLDTVAAASVKLTSQLSKQDEESKGAAQALKAIGLNFEEFTSLAPVAQIDAVAKALAGFQDGSEKTAVAVALFGKSGAELIPFLNDLADGGQRTSGITREQARAADELTKEYARLLSQTKQVAQEYSSELVKVLSDSLKVYDQVIAKNVSLRDEFGNLKLSDDFREFTESVVLGLAVIGETIVGIIKLFGSLGDSVNTLVADAKIVGFVLENGFLALDDTQNAKLETLLKERNEAVRKENQAYLDLWNYNGTDVSDSLRKQFADIKSQTANFDPLGELNRTLGRSTLLDLQIPLRPGAGGGSETEKPKIDFDPLAEEKRLKAYEEAVKKASEEAKKFISEQDAARQSLFDLNLGLQTQVETFGLSEEAVLAYRLSVGDLSDEVAKAGPLGEEYAKSILAESKALRDRKQAADEALNSVQRQFDLDARRLSLQRELEGIGAGPQQRRFNAGVQNIQDEVTGQRQRLDLGRIQGQISPEVYQQQLQALNQFQNQATADWEQYFSDLEARNADFTLAINDALLTYIDSIRNVGDELGSTLVGALQSATDATANLAAETLLWGGGGVEAAKAIARSLITETVAGFAKAGIQAALFYTLNKAGIISTTAVSTAAQTTTAATATATNATIAATAAPAAALTSLASFGSNAVPAALGIALVAGAIGALIGGAFADGGPVKGPGTGTSDSILARLSNGEFVMKASAVNRLGVDYLTALNNGMPAFADGGMVGVPKMQRMSEVIGSRVQNEVRVAVVDSDKAAEEFAASSRFDTYVIRAMQRNRGALNLSGVRF